MNIQLKVSWQCEQEKMPPVLFNLLQEILNKGSLRAAAGECNISYRHAWGLMQTWEGILSSPLVVLQRGRGKGAYLTEVGEKLLWEYRRISARVEPELASLASEISTTLVNLTQKEEKNSLRLVASHGLVIASLRELAQQELQLNLDIQFKGSLDSLQQYKNGLYDMAGFHLPEGKLGQSLVAKMRQFIDPKTDVLVYAVRRRQGLMVLAGNSKKIHSAQDLVKENVQFINRQSSSGTRHSLDAILQEAKVDTQKIKGYDNEEFTHNAVAALVVSGAVDCGFGIEAAAAQFKLDFIPLNWESYWFVLPKEKLNRPAFRQFIQLLQCDAFNQSVALLKGYETQRSGNIVVADETLSVLLD